MHLPPRTTLAPEPVEMGDLHCLECGELVDLATAVNDPDAKPKPDDITICLYCGHLMAFTEELGLRELTYSEVKEIAGDTRVIDIQKARQRAGY